ncbi:MAG: xanthine dehydrogenase family protein molybdopterin-binding subunit [Acidimicrobiia bacterium]
MTIGTSVPRSDGAAKVSGDAVYTVDVEVPGTLHAKLLRSPVAAGRITRLDTTEAQQMLGVWSVLTAKDAPSTRYGLVVKDQRIFADGYVTFEGEPLAAVAADSPAIARAAVAAISLEIEEQEPVTDLDEALAEQGRLVHPDPDELSASQEFPRYGNVCGELLSDPQGVDEAFARAHTIVEEEFRAQRQYQAHLEVRGVLAEYTSGRYTIHVSHQYPFNVRDRLAEALGIRPSDIRVVGHHIGGGFGAKLDITIEPHAALLARASGRPVKLVLDRTEDLITAPSREDALWRLRSAVSEEGEILARVIDVRLDAGAAATDAPYLCSIPFLVAGAPYRTGPTRVTSRAVYTNTAPTGAFRGVSGTHTVFALERHMDHIARELGVDRRELRRRNLLGDGDRLLNGQELPDASILGEAFERIEEAAPWAALGKGANRGVGIAACVWLTNPMPGSVVLKLHEDGTLGVVTGATDNGSGAVAMGVTQVAAAEMGMEPTDVVVSFPDTDAAPYDAGSQGSRTTHVVGRATHEAAAVLREKVYEVAAQLLEAAPGDLELHDGSVRVKGVPDSDLSLAEVASAATFIHGGPLAATGSYATPTPSYDPTCASGLLFPTFPTPTYHVHVAEVEVDPVTGGVTVLRYLVAQEVGKAINPDGVIGQIQGGVAQGLGYALYEGLRFGADGRYEQRTLETYRLPVAVDTPRTEVILLEHPDEAGPFGAKGVAEPPIVPVAAAIGNAVADAIGRPIRDIPITPERVLEALGRLPGTESPASA